MPLSWPIFPSLFCYPITLCHARIIPQNNGHPCLFDVDIVLPLPQFCYWWTTIPICDVVWQNWSYRPWQEVQCFDTNAKLHEYTIRFQYQTYWSAAFLVLLAICTGNLRPSLCYGLPIVGCMCLSSLLVLDNNLWCSFAICSISGPQLGLYPPFYLPCLACPPTLPPFPPPRHNVFRGLTDLRTELEIVFK